MNEVLAFLVLFMHLLSKFFNQKYGGDDGTSIDYENVWRQNDIMPKYILSTPSNELQLTYGNQKYPIGQKLSASSVQPIPDVRWNGCKKDTLYSLINFDSDFESPYNETEKSNFIQWLVFNIPECDAKQGDHVAVHLGAFTSSLSGYHRSVFLLFEQAHRIETRFMARFSFFNVAERMDFNVTALFERQGWLRQRPLAGMLYLVKYDDSVQVILDKIKINTPWHDST